MLDDYKVKIGQTLIDIFAFGFTKKIIIFLNFQKKPFDIGRSWDLTLSEEDSFISLDKNVNSSFSAILWQQNTKIIKKQINFYIC